MFVVLPLLCSIAFSKLFIRQPEDLRKSFEDPAINYSIANFGHIPYGRTFSGLLQLPPPNPSGNETEYDLCEPPQSVGSGNLRVSSASNATGGSHWLLARRGNCTFTRKARNAQELGAQLLIIVDSSEDVSHRVIIMGDDGNGYQVNIPSIFIGKNDGDKLIKFLEAQAEASSVDKLVMAVISFNDTNKVEKPQVLFGLSLNNRETFKLIREFQPHFEKLKDSISMNIYYELITCWFCAYNDFKKEEENCLGGGRYCNLDPDGQGIANGQNVIYEELRQYCLFQLKPEKWFEYMNQFDTVCLKAQQYDECSKKLINDEQLHQQVSKCVVDSFNSDNNNQKLTTNKILEQWQEFGSSSGIVYYPGATVNNVTYRGGVDAFDITEDICSGMLTQAPYCAQLNYEGETEDDRSYIGLIATVVAVCLIFMLFMVFIYRRMLKRELSREMGQQVNQMVSQYISFYEQKSNRSM